MKKSRINPVSKKQQKEIGRRIYLKQALIDTYGKKCQTCGSKGDWRGISLSHIVPLSRGGKTERSNIILECYPDHERYEKKPELREQEHPKMFERLPYLVRMNGNTL